MKRACSIATPIAVALGGGMWLHDRPSDAAQQSAAIQSLAQIAVENVLTRDFADSAGFTGRLHAVDCIDVRARVSGFASVC
jgi:hypothetical protein